MCSNHRDRSPLVKVTEKSARLVEMAEFIVTNLDSDDREVLNDKLERSGAKAQPTVAPSLVALFGFVGHLCSPDFVGMLKGQFESFFHAPCLDVFMEARMEDDIALTETCLIDAQPAAAELTYGVITDDGGLLRTPIFINQGDR